MNKLQPQKQIITGWGRTNYANVTLASPSNIYQLQQLVSNASKGSILARGLGRSYGDAATLQNSTVIELSNFNKLSINDSTNIVTAEAGVSIEYLL